MNRQADWTARTTLPVEQPLPAAEAPPGAGGAEDVPPRKVYVELTTECNLDCAMCIRSSWRTAGGTMSEATFDALLAGLAETPTVGVLNFSGFGEPMGHPRFFEFLARAKQAGLAVEVVTNGTLLDDRAAEALIELELDRLVVSVDGIADGTSRGLHESTFGQVAARLKALHHLRMARRVRRPVVGIEFVATRRNIHELAQLQALGLMLGFESILVTNVIPHTPELAGEILYGRHSTASRPRRPGPANPVVDLPQFDAHSPAGAVVERLRGIGAHLRVNGVDVSGAGPRCRFVTEGRLAVRWDGAVSPCLALLHDHAYFFRGRGRQIRAWHVGSVRDAPPGRLWAQADFAAFRDRVRRWDFSPCIDCGGCDLREANQRDCTGEVPPRCGECLWAAGIVQCP